MKFLQYLTEKLIVINGTKGKKYGNVIILAGGAASGKGFAVANFMEGNLYKIRDIDEVKTLFLKIAELKDKYPEIRGLDLSRADDVGKLHQFITLKKIKNKTFDLLMKDVRPGQLPNILFDITFRDLKAANFHWIKMMIDELGYNPLDINLVWILTDYTLAVKQNRDPKRGRVVPDNILLGTHEGAAVNMVNVIKGRVPQTNDKSLFNGSIHIILNNREHTLYWADSEGNVTSDPSKAIMTKPSQEKIDLHKKTKGKKGAIPQPVIKDFKYLTVKEKGKPIISNADILKQLFDWIKKNAPITLDIDKVLKYGEK